MAEIESLTPNVAEKVFEGEGGSYHKWSASTSPVLGESKVGAGRLVLQHRGFALPHYADCSKVGYVLQGNEGLVGMVFPNTTSEIVLNLKKGDVIPVPVGSVSWWYNNGDSEWVIVFLGETSNAYLPGEFTYFLLSGALGVFRGFSTEFSSRAYNLNHNDADKLTNSQTGVLIVKLDPNKTMPKPGKAGLDTVRDIDSARPDVTVSKAGSMITLTPAKFRALQPTGLSVNSTRLDGNAMRSPFYLADGSVQVIYVVKGSGMLQMVGLNGEQALDAKIEAGQLVVVPKFFTVSMIAGDEGLDWFSVTTTADPMVEELGGGKSVWHALSPVVIQASLDVTPEFVQVFKSNIKNSTMLVPPPN
ncbi:11S globulin seed storage protein 2-like [Tripterygium wilfordii]|uniref:11S globulin seed storage protein 2-like n=1 Tax=Tripterygium wilfordii TaxID=458696 RepID=UPI0018F85395|nr:11S globulin seed storage protein 2-like [Tripterygium wilfordii]